MSEPELQNFIDDTLNHLNSLHYFALSLCKNKFDAEDLVSETLLKAIENYNKLRDKNKLKPWLLKILNNQFISTYRSRKKITELFQPVNQNGKDGDFSLFKKISSSSFVNDNNPEREFINSLNREQIDEAIKDLPIDLRTTLILCDVEGLSYMEISKIMNTPIGTVRSRISRARVKLQKKLWVQAQEMGIKPSKRNNQKSGYICTCGEESSTQKKHKLKK